MTPGLGQHFTPPALARWLIEQTLDGFHSPQTPMTAIDPACGQGALLSALAEMLPNTRPGRLIGVEIDPPVAAVARERLSASGAQILTKDALALAGREPLQDGSADLVLLNPPYIGEKGHKALFEAAAALGPRWAGRMAPRMDYLYFFLHLGLDVLRPGGRMMALTTAYWPSATSAARLRADLLARSQILSWVEITGTPFGNAPGQHNLAVILERTDQPAQTAWPWHRVHCTRSKIEIQTSDPGGAAPTNAEPWQPFVTAANAQRAHTLTQRWGTRLGDIAKDRQGVVSGCDRVSKRHLALLPAGIPEGAPVFVLSGAEIAARGWARDPKVRPFLRPLWRGSSTKRLDLRDTLPGLEDPQTTAMLYLHRTGPEPPEVLLDHLRPFRVLLERRREVKQGKLPWWALHWPRDGAAMARPKIVTARRGARIEMGLDLAGHCVSSDCTWIQTDSGDLDDLRLLWETLHLPEVEAVLRAVGKRKGGLLEFYSEPLRRLPIPLEIKNGKLVSIPAARR